MEKEKPKLIQAEIALILIAEPQENKATPMHPPFQFQFSKHAPTIAEEKE